MTKKLFISMLALLAIATTAGAQENSVNGHEYVDLGLPSGLLWATCNVGATKPEECGAYFAWGETTAKKDYSWETYKWGTEDNLIKYTDSDGLTELEAEYDAATVKWKGGWRMPTIDEIKELLDNTTNKWVADGVGGRLFTSKANGNSIFLPASGIYIGTYLASKGSISFYWSSVLGADNTAAYGLSSGKGGTSSKGDRRSNGGGVRPVISKEDVTTGIDRPTPNPSLNGGRVGTPSTANG
ncbi:MAG: hypothetical protein IKS72_02990 [Prevotella sp.]|nr:hypothetical protein [Prevotella sp.]